MSCSATNQKGFDFLLLLIIWNSSTFPGNTAENHLHFLLGCRAVIPCQHYSGDSDSFQWLYKKDEHHVTIKLIFQAKNGLPYHSTIRPKRNVTLSRSLVIDHFTEDDQGLYWCENCHRGKCPVDQPTVVVVKKEILKEIHNQFYITAGSSFEQACPGGSMNYKWTYEASTPLGKSVPGPETNIVTSNKPIYIMNVNRTDAGTYTCWTSCDGRSYKLLTINLCVVTVHRNEDSSVSCAVFCDVGLNNPSTTNVENISVSVDSHGYLNCSVGQIFNGHTVTSSVVPTTVFSKTTGAPTESRYLVPVFCGVTVPFACLILMALLFLYFRQRILAAFPCHLCCCGLKGRVENDRSVVYSSIAIRTPSETTGIHMTYSDCVYSELKL